MPFSSEVGLALTHIFLIRVFSCQGSQQSVCQKSLLPFFDKLTRQNGALLMPLTIFHSVLKLTQKSLISLRIHLGKGVKLWIDIRKLVMSQMRHFWVFSCVVNFFTLLRSRKWYWKAITLIVF